MRQKETALKIGVVGRGRLGGALARAADSAGHAVTLLRRPTAAAQRDSALAEAVIDANLAWDDFDLVLLAFEKAATTVAELADDETLRELRRISPATVIASVVMRPSPELLDAFLPSRTIAHFLTTPAASLPGAIALVPQRGIDTAPLETAFPTLHWIEASEPEYARLAFLMLGGAMAAAALAHLTRLLDGEPTPSEAAYLQQVLDDAKRLLRLHDGDGFRAFDSVATPGGFTENVHNRIFARKWPLEP